MTAVHQCVSACATCSTAAAHLGRKEAELGGPPVVDACLPAGVGMLDHAAVLRQGPAVRLAAEQGDDLVAREALQGLEARTERRTL